ncbi:MAG: MBL fold metallo-hydrolase [Clostridium sp.]|nr:MBL fold metallo-hydrolase [Clostridium sp.]
MSYEVRKLEADLWAIEEEMVRCYLLHGNAGNLLIDACMSGGSALHETVTTLIGDAPLQCAITHSDRDHTGGFQKGDVVFVHPAEYEHLGDCEFTATPLWDGTSLPAGNRTLKAIVLPGHTPGSTIYADEANKVIFSGDILSAGPVFLFGNGRNLPAYIASLERLAHDYPNYQYYTCHGPTPLPAVAVSAQLTCAIKLQRGELNFEEAPNHFPCKLYRYQDAALYY